MVLSTSLVVWRALVGQKFKKFVSKLPGTRSRFHKRTFLVQLLLWRHFSKELKTKGNTNAEKRQNRHNISINTRTIGNRKGACAWRCSRWQTQPDKNCKSQPTNQCHSLRILYWFVLCNLQIFSGCVCHLEQRHAQSPFLFPIVFSTNLIPFFNICSVPAVLSPGVVGYVLFYLGHCVVATVAVCGFGSWSLVFHCGMARQISPLPPTPSQTEVCSTMGESIRPSSFHNPKPSAKKHSVQICRSSLSAAVQTDQVSVEPYLSTALKDRSVVPNHKD